MKTIILDEYLDLLHAQWVPSEHLAFICPVCGLIQSAWSFKETRNAIRFDEVFSFKAVEQYVGFSCVGRFVDMKPFNGERDYKGCDWTLGGLLQQHKLEVVTPDGAKHPTFEVATPEEAQRLMDFFVPKTHHGYLFSVFLGQGKYGIYREEEKV